MATPYQVHVVPEDSGLWKFKQDKETAEKTSELLQEDLQKHHVFFNDDGFHNHIPHHLLSLFGTGAGPSSLQKAWDGNANYQRHALKPHDRVPEELRDWAHAKQYLGNEKYYPDFLVFFQREMERHGWEHVVNEYLFKRDAKAEDLLVRLFGGFLHPLIQLMYGLEWKQPAIVAEALAQTCVHRNDLREFLMVSEQNAAASSSSAAMPSILSLYEAVRNDPKLAAAAHDGDANKVRDGVLVRAKDEIIKVASQVRVQPEELDARTAEMFNAAVLVAASAAVHPPKYPKFDFFLMHHVNSAPIFLTINAAPWIAAADKARILEWKIRMDLLQYAARAAPPASLDRIASYTPRDDDGRTVAPPHARPVQSSGERLAGIAARLHDLEDDGHAIKLARATAICRQLTEGREGRFENDERLQIKGEEMWDRLLRLIVDSVTAPGEKWVRTTGLETAWKDVPDQPKL